MSKLIDFYYSEKHFEHSINDSFMIFSGESKRPKITKFKGEIYTECIEHGLTPLTNHFGDLKFLGTGTYNDITFS